MCKGRSVKSTVACWEDTREGTERADTTKDHLATKGSYRLGSARVKGKGHPKQLRRQ